MPDEIVLKYIDGENELPEMDDVELFDLLADKQGKSPKNVLSKVRRIIQSYRSGW